MREIFCDAEVLQSIDDANGTVILKEEINKQKILIGGVPADSILLKLDIDKVGYKEKSKYLRRGSSFLHKGCDYCLIIPSKNIIVLFELKSQQPKPKDYVEQFAASEIFMTYCKNLHDYKISSASNYIFKRVLLSSKFNYNLTSGVMKIAKEDALGRNIDIVTPGFPDRIRLEKLL